MVSPSFTAYGKTCIGSTSKQISIRLTSKPTPVLSSPKTFAPLCSGNHFYYDPASNVKATIFMWKRPALTNINEGFEKNGIERIEDTLFNKGTQIQKVKYEYTLTANGCTNTQKDTVQMDVYPYFNKGNIGTSHQTVCNNTPIQQAEPTQAEGGNGAIFYEWRMKKDTNAEQVVSTTANYQIPATTQAGVYTYTRWTKNETCQSTWIQSEGEYIITVLPALQATIAVTSNFNGLDIEEPGINNGRAKVVVNGGVEPYSYLWSSSETIDSIQNKAPGTYSVSVYDANKCSLTKSISIKPIVFTPQIIEDTSRFYVTYLGDGLRDGSSWKNAFPRQILQYALDTAGEIARYPKKQGEIWLGIGENYVIAGKGVAKFSPNSIYKYSPFVNDTNDPRAKSFVVPSGVGLFGNFAGHESSKKRPRRNSYMTVLSGDLKQTPDNTEDDAYNVLVFGDGVNGLSKPAYVNGVEITSGNANHPKNASMQLGGAIVAVDNATIQSVLVMHNKAKKGAVYMQGQSYLNSSLLYANTAEQGGAIYTKSYRDFNNGPVIAYNTIVNNQASTNGAGVYLNPYVVFVGNVVWNNSIDGISENNNIAFYVNDKNRYKIDYVFANDSAIQMMSSTSVKLSNSNRDTLNGGPMFADPLNDTGRVSPYQSLAFMLTDYSPMRNSLILPNPEYAPRFLRLEDYDLYGAPRQAANNSIDFNAAEYGKHEPLQPTLNRLYVSSRRKGLANGSSWANTTNNLSEAVAYFYKQTPTNGERFEVWVSDGTFFPRTPTSTNTDTRKMAFVLNENIDIYGGFRGLEGDENQMDSITRPRSDYNGDGNIDAWEYTYMTTLSGNVNPANGNLSSYHVLYRTQGSLQSTLDGLRVVSGNANGPTLEDQLGGGLYTQQAIKIKHCAFKANAASKTGNGAAVYAVNSLIDASYFISNYIDGENADTNLTTGVVAMNGGIIQNSVIQKNHTSGVFALGDKAPTILNTTIVGNTAGIIDMADANTQIKNSIIWDNKRTLNANTEYAAVLHLNGSMDVLYSAVDDAAESLNGEFITELNKDNVAFDGPQFTKVNAPDNNNNYRLNCKSMLINLGNTFQWTDQDLDFAARARIVETVDMGAYETQHLDLQGGEIQSTGERICYNSVPMQTIKSISVAQGGSGQNTYYWYYNDTLIEGATQASYLPTQTLTADAVYTRRSYNDCGLETPAQGKWQVKVSALPSVSLSGDAKINKGEAAILKLAFTGTAPFTYRLSNDVNDRIHNSQDTLFLELYPNISTVYKVISLFDSNACTVPSDSLKGEAYVSVAEYVDISFERTFNGTILPSKSGRMLKGTPVSVTIRPNDSYYLQKLLAGTQKDTINRTSLPLYLDAENNSLVIDFIATQDSNIMAIFAPVSKWKNNLEDLRFTKDSNTVYIYSPGELASLAQQTNVYKKTYSQVQVKLMRDLDMGGVQDSMGVWDRAASAKWIPIASDSLAHFHGEFDGNNKQIKNLYVNVLQDNAGLFGALGRWAFVKNLAITSGFIRGENNVGSIAGILYSNANIAEVFSMASIEATQTHAGGLVGVNYGSIENAYNVGLVQATEYVGGIAGENRGSIANTYNVGQVKGTANVFSISSSKGKIENSYYEPQLIGLD
ncbi:MAG: PKD-like domain-containing protein, partial [Bacteroidales bacterium]